MTQVPRQLTHTLAVARQERAPLQAQRFGQHGGVRVRVAILVAAHPRPKPNGWVERDPDARVVADQRLGQLLVHLRNGVEEGALQVEERIPDFIEHAQTDRSNFIRVPEDLDLGRDPLSDAVALTG